MISLVVPTFKERKNIERLVERAGAALAAAGEPFELIIVDDDSPDGTGDEVRRLQTSRPWLQLLVRKNERDLSTAVIAGWRVATGDVLGCMDADLQHPPEVLGAMIARLKQTQADIVVGSRHVTGGGVSNWSLARRFVSWTATLMATFILPGTLGKVLDPMSGFFLLRRRVVDRVALNPIGYKILLEVLARGDYDRVEEVPFVFEERVEGGSKMDSKTVLYYLVHLVCIAIETGEARRMLKYGLVGLSGAVVNFAVALGLEARYGVPLPTANLPAVGAAILNNFIWNDLFTFWETRQSQPGLGNWFKRLAAFALFSFAGSALNVVLVAVLTFVGLPHMLCLLIGIAVAGLFNFFVNSNVTWRAWWNRHLLARTQAPETQLDPVEMHGLGKVACNFCGAEKYKILYPGDPRQLGDLPAQAFRCTSEGHGDFTNIVQCGQCGLLYQNPRETEAITEAKYAGVVDPTYEQEAEGRRRTFRIVLDRIRQHAAPPGRVLDIGCYIGVFLDVARAAGWQTAGVEPSTWAAGKAAAQGHAVSNSSLQNFEAAESFDLVTLWDVVEHLHDPQEQLRLAFRALKPGGVFALSTMNVGSLFAKLAGRHWPMYMRMHYYYFTPATLGRMLTAAGFEVLAVEPHQRVVSLRYLIRKVFSLLGPLAVVGRVIGYPLGGIFVTVDFGDNMNVYCRRPAGK
jgi:dolichol-phosphate mannosyltransferase